MTEAEVLSGKNRFAIETERGWEVIGAANVTLIGNQTYRVSQMLRDVSAAGRSGVAAEHIYSAAHLRPLSIAHLSAEPVEEGVKISWIPRNIDGNDALDPSAQFEINWPNGRRLTPEISEILPILPGSGTEISTTIRV